MNDFISFLIDIGTCISYISPQMVEKCKLKTEKDKNAWLVQLATITKRKVTSHINQFPIDLNGFPTKLNLNILPLGSYEVLIVMDWLEKHRALVDCYEKKVFCNND